ncbi:hypothetical protein [Streptomyces sp. NBC_01506]|uniref:hypothetical protein n=1 Tax=Streptomyces sp. NBC_01506 TaxID=2903887 RepID=UPI0038696342
MAHVIAVPQIETETFGHEAYIVAEAAREHPAPVVTDTVAAILARLDPAYVAKETSPGALREALTEAVSTIADPPVGLLAEAQTTLIRDVGLGALRTAEPLESELRDIDADGLSDNTNVPWLAAEVVVHAERSQAYGRKTTVWTHYGVHTGELTPARGREALAAMRDFADRYEALLDFADQVAADDFEGDPEIARLDTEAEDRRIKAITKGRRA